MCTISSIDTYKGHHGYNNSIPDMWGVFIAYGPAFKVGHKSPAVDVIDLYPLMSHLLNLHPKGHDGSLYNIRDVLKDDVIWKSLLDLTGETDEYPHSWFNRNVFFTCMYKFGLSHCSNVDPFIHSLISS